MCRRYFGFFLLVWFPGVLQGQNVRHSCTAPRLEGGVFAPHKDSYPHGMTLIYNCEDGRKTPLDGWWAIVKCGNGQWSHTPQCISSGPREVSPTISLCGRYPTIANGDVVVATPVDLKYQCNSYYKLVGPATVSCYSDGIWSIPPTCKEAFCVLDPAQHAESGLLLPAVSYLRDQETINVECNIPNYRSVAQCSDGQLSLTRCCPGFLHIMRMCH